MDAITLMIPMGALAGHGLAAFHPGAYPRESSSIGDQQAEMALLACRAPEASDPAERALGWSELLCLHCGGMMRVLEDRRIGAAIHLSAECPRCGCLRATYVDLTPASQRFLELPQEASFD